MNWVFALNEKSPDNPNGENYELLAKIAVHSAKLFAPSLRPYLIWNGDSTNFTKSMQSMGVNVLFHRLSFQDAIDNTPRRNAYWHHTAKGAFLRLDIPEIFNDFEGKLLYTDVDVIFSDDPGRYSFPVNIFAFSSEFDFNDFVNINTGTMILDLARSREVFPKFREWTAKNLSWIPDYDQGAIRAYFNCQWDRLDQRMNWKPYWNTNSDPIITHFHGPKPSDFDPITLMPKFSASEKPTYWRLYSHARASYSQQLRRWISVAHDFFTSSQNFE